MSERRHCYCSELFSAWQYTGAETILATILKTTIELLVMKKISTLVSVVLLVLLASCGDDSTNTPLTPNTEVNLDTTEALLAFDYLNRVRENPPAFSVECNINLSGVAARPDLTYNIILERVAREKATDMAKRGYFSHQDPDGRGVDHKIVAYGYPLDAETYFIDQTTCNYESLQTAGQTGGKETLTGVEAIRGLIWDGGGPTGGHREHLLGIGIRSTLDEIGIGFVRAKEGAMFKNYTCVIIAKRKK